MLVTSTFCNLAHLCLVRPLPLQRHAADAARMQTMHACIREHGARVQAILLLGGHDGQQWTTVMHLIYPELSAVEEFDQIPFAQGYGGSILLGRSIYVIGGGDGQAWNRTAFNFDLDSKDWFQVRIPVALPPKLPLLFWTASQGMQKWGHVEAALSLL